jgi:hypothetical protein
MFFGNEESGSELSHPSRSVGLFFFDHEERRAFSGIDKVAFVLRKRRLSADSLECPEALGINTQLDASRRSG